MLSTHYTGAEGTNGSDKMEWLLMEEILLVDLKKKENEVYFDYVPLRDYDKANETKFYSTFD